MIHVTAGDLSVRAAALLARVTTAIEIVVIAEGMDVVTAAELAETWLARPGILLVVCGVAGEQLLAKLSGSRAARVYGTGTVAATARLRRMIARRCRVDERDVMAFVAGGQGVNGTPLWSSAAVAGVLLSDWAVAGHGKVTVRDRIQMTQGLRGMAEDEDLAEFDEAWAAAEVVKGLDGKAARAMGVATVEAEFGGQKQVVVAFPRLVGAGGAGPMLPLKLNPAETAGLAEFVRRQVQ